MILRPADLGRVYARDIVLEWARQRQINTNWLDLLVFKKVDVTPTEEGGPKRRTGPTARWIAKRIHWSADDVAQALREIGSPTKTCPIRSYMSAIPGIAIGFFIGQWIQHTFVIDYRAVIFCAIVSTWNLLFRFFWARKKCREFLNYPLTEWEATFVASRRTATVNQELGGLVSELIAKQDLPAESQEYLRQSLRAIGETVSRLPAETPPLSANPAEMRRNAVAVRVKAESEPDAVTRDSLLRQADAFEQGSVAAERAALTARRTAAQHDETLAQIKTLRVRLAASDFNEVVTASSSMASVGIPVLLPEPSALLVKPTQLDVDTNQGSSGNLLRLGRGRR